MASVFTVTAHAIHPYCGRWATSQSISVIADEYKLFPLAYHTRASKDYYVNTIDLLPNGRNCLHQTVPMMAKICNLRLSRLPAMFSLLTCNMFVGQTFLVIY